MTRSVFGGSLAGLAARTMSIETAKSPIPAAQKLLDHIRGEADGQGKPKTIPAWCQEHRLDRLKVQKAINGDVTRIDVNFAVDCERATGGAVPAEDWYVTEDVKAEIDRLRRERAA